MQRARCNGSLKDIPRLLTDSIGAELRNRAMRARIIVFILATLCAGSSLAWGQQQRADFSAQVELVLLHVAVVDPQGRYIPPLSVEDFKVFDDDVEQEIELFLAPTDAPVDIALVLDSSASMAPVARPTRRAALAFVRRLDVDDCVFALPFRDVVGPGQWGRSADSQLHGFIDRIRPGGGTSLYDALLEGLSALELTPGQALVELANEARAGQEGDEAPEVEDAAADSESGPTSPAGGQTGAAGTNADRLNLPPPRVRSLRSQVGAAIRELGEGDTPVIPLDVRTPAAIRGCGDALPPGAAIDHTNTRRKALVVLSDGADLNSTATFYDALGAARAASVPVFPVAFGYANDDPALKSRLGELARATGGLLIENSTPDRLVEAYDDVVALLRSFYLVGYDPGPGGEAEGTLASGRARWHDVRVELRRPNFETLVRPGYYR